MILTSSNKGYKLPATTDDLTTYVEQAHSVISPMIMRLKSVRDQILLATKGQYDVLNQDPYKYITDLAEGANDGGGKAGSQEEDP